MDESTRIPASPLVSTRALARLERLETMSVLAGGVAHDIASLVGTMLISAESALSNTKDASVRAELDVIASCAKHAGGLVEKLLQYARPPDNKLTPVNLSEVIESNRMLIRRIAGHRVRIEFELEMVPVVLTRPECVLSAAINLVQNAADAMGAGGGTIVVACRYDGSNVTFSVSDDGPGFTVETQARAFEPFFTTKSHGFGLGLALVQRMGDCADADVEIRSIEDRGATVSIAFPVAA